MLLLSKTLSQSLSFMFEAVIVAGIRRQLPSPKGANRGLSWSTMSSFEQLFSSALGSLERGIAILISSGNVMFEENI